MNDAEPIVIETRYSAEAAAAAQAWGRRSIYPFGMRLFALVWGMVAGLAAGAGVMVLTQLAFLEYAPQMRSRSLIVFPVVAFAAILFLWVRYQRFHLARLSAPRGDTSERYVFDSKGFHETTDGAARRYDWWLVDDMGNRGGDVFLRIGTVLHTVPNVGDAARIAAIRALWQAGRAR